MIRPDLHHQWPEPSTISYCATAVLSVAMAILAAELITRLLHAEPIASSMLYAVIFAAWRQDETHQALVTVTDSGVGVSAEDADRLFNAFFTTKSGGMGMGLAIRRSIVEAHGGRMSVANNVGPGARFQFTLPLHQEGTP
jgi:signal transduction histidine kinase